MDTPATILCLIDIVRTRISRHLFFRRRDGQTATFGSQITALEPQQKTNGAEAAETPFNQSLRSDYQQPPSSEIYLVYEN